MSSASERSRCSADDVISGGIERHGRRGWGGGGLVASSISKLNGEGKASSKVQHVLHGWGKHTNIVHDSLSSSPAGGAASGQRGSRSGSPGPRHQDLVGTAAVPTRNQHCQIFHRRLIKHLLLFHSELSGWRIWLHQQGKVSCFVPVSWNCNVVAFNRVLSCLKQSPKENVRFLGPRQRVAQQSGSFVISVSLL